MIRHSKPKIQLLEPIIYDQPAIEQESQAFNPEDDATNRLIQISSQEINQNFLEVQINQQIKVRRPKEQLRIKQTKILMPKCEKNRLSVVQNFTQSHRIWRKQSVRLLEEESKLIDKPQCVKNQSSFIIFQNGYLNNLNSCEYSHISFGQGFNRTQKARPPRNIMSLIKRKNINSFKQSMNVQKNQQIQNSIGNSRIKKKRNFSPTERIYKSCELKKEFQSISPIKITTNQKMTEQKIHQLRCTNPNFRNKKISNYMKMRASGVTKIDSPN